MCRASQSGTRGITAATLAEYSAQAFASEPAGAARPVSGCPPSGSPWGSTLGLIDQERPEPTTVPAARIPSCGYVSGFWPIDPEHAGQRQRQDHVRGNPPPPQP